MYYLISFFISAITAVMILINGKLSDYYGVYISTVIIHIVGLIFISAAAIIKKQNVLKALRLKWTFLLGGVIGVATTLFNNAAFGKINVSTIIALGLLGQSVSSLIIDQFGFFGMKTKKFKPFNIAGLLFTALGITILFRGSNFLFVPVMLSFLAGVSIVLSRCINARLSEKTSVIISTWFNYVMGLITCSFILIVAFSAGISPFPQSISLNPWIYAGGALGFVVVSLLSVVTYRMAAFNLTLVLFSGQMFVGIIIDAFIEKSFSASNFFGGLLAVLGLAFNIWIEKRKTTKTI